ncbi:MAG: response regulator transcription factor [Bacillota bacterium]
MNKVLIIEDEVALVNILKSVFIKEGIEVDIAYNGEQGLMQFKTRPYDCVILDITMPRLDGWAVLEAIRKRSDVPIIMMTALSGEDYELRGYDMKADDYVTKPFSPRVLVAKVKNVMERYEGKPHKTRHTLHLGRLVIDLDKHTVRMGEQALELSKKEFDLMVFLIEQKGFTLSREQILEHVWGYDSFAGERVVDAFVKSLRKKLGKPYADRIKTVRGVGYRLDEEGTDE